MHKEHKLVQRAKNFAMHAHANVKQVRKYTGLPYIVHPAAVVAILEQLDADATPEMLAAAWLHDTVEDTETTLEDIQQEFGELVAEYVQWLTKPEYEDPQPTRAVRKKDVVKVLKDAPYEVQTIKIADILDNTKDIAMRDPELAKLVLKESRVLLGALHTADIRLKIKLTQQLFEQEAILKAN